MYIVAPSKFIAAESVGSDNGYRNSANLLACSLYKYAVACRMSRVSLIYLKLSPSRNNNAELCCTSGIVLHQRVSHSCEMPARLASPVSGSMQRDFAVTRHFSLKPYAILYLIQKAIEITAQTGEIHMHVGTWREKFRLVRTSCTTSK